MPNPKTFSELVLVHSEKTVPIGITTLLSDTSCALERVGALVSKVADTLEEDIASASSFSEAGARQIAYDSYMFLRICDEKIDETAKMVEIAEVQYMRQHADGREQAITSIVVDTLSQHIAPDRTAWEAGLRAYYLTVDATKEQEKVVEALPQAQAVEDETLNAAVDIQTAALDDLLAIRAPDAGELLLKLHIIDKEGYHNNSMAWASIVDDVRALTGTEAQ